MVSSVDFLLKKAFEIEVQTLESIPTEQQDDALYDVREYLKQRIKQLENE